MSKSLTHFVVFKSSGRKDDSRNLFPFNAVEQCFSTFFDSWQPFRPKKFGGTLKLVLTTLRHPRRELLINFIRNTSKQCENPIFGRHPQDLFTAPQCAAAPRLRTTALICLHTYLYSTYVFCFCVCIYYIFWNQKQLNNDNQRRV